MRKNLNDILKKLGFDRKSLMQFLVVAVGSQTIFSFFAIRSVLYNPLIETLGVTNTEFGILMSLTGLGVLFAAVLGLMVGFPGILLAIWISAVGGGLIAIGLILAGRKGRKDVIPFGPFMAIGAAVVLIAGPDLIDWYQDLASAISGT